jgi:hypothetical protein
MSSPPSLYLNVFVGVAQAFQKVPDLKKLAPTQKEPPFVVTQVVALLAFVAFGAWAVINFQPDIGLRGGRFGPRKARACLPLERSYRFTPCQSHPENAR